MLWFVPAKQLDKTRCSVSARGIAEMHKAEKFAEPLSPMALNALYRPSAG